MLATCPESGFSGYSSSPGSSSSLPAAQVQERLTQQVADWLQQHLEPRGVGVVLEAEHLCMTVRGVRAPGGTTVTSALHGHLRHDAAPRAEFFTLIAAHQRPDVDQGRPTPPQPNADNPLPGDED